MSFTINIEQFEGPLDLMLHLIKVHKLDLLDLDVFVLCDQYLAYIKAMESLKLEIASEYLSELAALIEYKSKKLLPKTTVEISEEFEEDQTQLLVERLIEYQRFKDVSQVLDNQYQSRALLLDKPAASLVINPTTKEVLSINAIASDLQKAMEEVIKRNKNTFEKTRLTIREITTQERLTQMDHLLKTSKRLSFSELCNDCTNVQMVVVTFLVVLDLIKKGEFDYEYQHKEIILNRRT